MIRRHYADEEPDVDECERNWWNFEDVFAADGCGRCGHGDHRTRDCPNVPASRGMQKPRRSKAVQIAATKLARENQ